MNDEDLAYTIAWTAIFVAGTALEWIALRKRPNERASLSAHVWWLCGPRGSWRWWLGAGTWSYITWHFFNHAVDEFIKEINE